jgi:hypothetical protein
MRRKRPHACPPNGSHSGIGQHPRREPFRAFSGDHSRAS